MPSSNEDVERQQGGNKAGTEETPASLPAPQPNSTAAAQQAVSYVMGVMFVALATAVILRTGALQMFARALLSGLRNDGGSSASTAALMWLSPSSKQLLGSSLSRPFTSQVDLEDERGEEPPLRDHHRTRNVRAHCAAAIGTEADCADAPEPASNAATSGHRGVQAPASVWLPFKTSSEKQHDEFIAARKSREDNLWRQAVWRLLRMLRFFRGGPAWLVSQLGFRIQQVALGGLIQKLVAVFVAGIPLVLAGGVVYSVLSGEHIMEGFTAVYGCLYHIPGVVVLGQGNIPRQIFTNMLWLVGTYLFAAVLGVITGDIMERIEAVMSGNNPVVAVNHTVILNWNRETIPLLRQISISRMERDSDVFAGDVVIMANKEKSQMDEEVRKALKGCKNMKWHTRSGSPHCITDLESVAAGQAQTVILLCPENTEGVAQKQVTAVMGVQTARSSTAARPFMKLSKQSIAVQVPSDPHEAKVLETASGVFEASNQKVQLTSMSGRRDMSLLAALSACQPGVASVYCAIVQQTKDGCEFYIKHFPELGGCTFREARRRLPDVILYGYIRTADKSLHSNPNDDDVLKEEDRIIAIASTGFFSPHEKPVGTSTPDVKPMQASLRTQNAKPGNEDHVSEPQKIVVLWSEGSIEDLTNSLTSLTPRGSEVTVISKKEPECFPSNASGPILRCKIFWQEGDPLDDHQHIRAGVASAHAVIIGTIESTTDKEADAAVLSTLLVLQHAVGSGKRDGDMPPLHVIGMVQRPETIGVANWLVGKLTKGAITAELLQPAELVSGALCQVAADPGLAGLLANFLYSQEGQGISLQRPSSYGIIDGSSPAFLEIQERAREQGETAIGWLSDSGPLHLAPHALQRHSYAPGDRVIIVGRDATD